MKKSTTHKTVGFFQSKNLRNLNKTAILTAHNQCSTKHDVQSVCHNGSALRSRPDNFAPLLLAGACVAF